MSAELELLPSGGRASLTRRALYDAAAALFIERGYEDTTMADIADRAGSSRRTAFNHFPNKGDIPMLWVRLMADSAVEVVEARAIEDVVERVRTYFHLISGAVESQPELSRQMMLGWTAAGGPIRYESQLLADVTPLLREGQGKGQIRAAVDVAEAARALSDVIQGAVFRWVRESDTPLQSRVDGVVSLVLSAVLSPD